MCGWVLVRTWLMWTWRMFGEGWRQTAETVCCVADLGQLFVRNYTASNRIVSRPDGVEHEQQPECELFERAYVGERGGDRVVAGSASVTEMTGVARGLAALCDELVVLSLA